MTAPTHGAEPGGKQDAVESPGRRLLPHVVLPLIVAAAIFYFDISMPLGVAAGIPYIPLVLMGLLSPKKIDILLLAAVGTALIAGAYTLSPPGSETWMVMTNRSLSVFAIWITATLCYRQRSLQDRAQNVTYRALQESENRFRILTDSAPFVILLKDVNGKVLLVNKLYEKEYGVAAQEVEGEEVGNLYSDSAARSLKAQDREVIETRGVVNREVETVGRDNIKRTKIITKFPITGPDGAIVAIGAIGTDITERKAAEEALRISEERFRRIFNDAGVGVWLTDANGEFVEVNRAVCDFLGYDEGELIGKTNVDVTHPDDVASTEERVRRIMSGDAGRMSNEKRFVRKDGKTVWAISNVAPIEDIDGKLQNVIVALQDITDRKAAEQALQESEERYRILSEALPDAILVTRSGGEIVYANQAAKKLFRASAAKPLLGLDMIELVHPDIRDDVIQRRDSALNGIAPHVAERRRLRLDGSEFLSQSRGVAITWDGQPAIAIIIRDLTEQRHMEEQLRQAQKMEAMGQLTGGIAHDFNNLLTIIQGNAELIDAEGRPELRPAKNILHAANRGAELTRRLLAYSRQQPLNPRAVDVAALVDNLSEILARTLGENVQIQTSAEPHLWPAVADTGQVENALLNLALNARDSMPDGGRLNVACANVRLDVTFTLKHPDASEGDYVEIAVADTGKGMTAETLAQAFDPFFTTKEVGQGSGMGLSMVYGFARQSGGYVTIDSVQGEGTTVRLFLPRGDSAAGTGSAANAFETMPTGDGRSILILEDDPEVRNLTDKMLQVLGYRVHAVPDAKAAFDYLEREGAVDLVLSDVILRDGMSGPQFAEKANAAFPGLRIIFMSGYSADAFAENGRLDQQNILLGKPFTLQELANFVHASLN